VDGVGFKPDQEITIGEIIAKYGDPNAVLVTPQGIPESPPQVSMIICYDKLNISLVLHDQDSAEYDLSPTSQITLIRYEDQTEYESSRKYCSATWHGYGTYDYKR
jgi:hypothetical protein